MRKNSVICSFFLTVPEQWTVMSHRPLSKSQSAPSFIQQIHTRTFMITHPMYQQQWPQETFQQHTETNVHLHANTQSCFSHAHCKVPLHTVWPVSSGSLRKDRDRTREDLHIPSQSPHDDRCSNQLGELQHSECCDVRKNIYHRNLTRVRSSPSTFDRSLPLHLSSPLARDVRSKPNYTTGRTFWVFRKKKKKCFCTISKSLIKYVNLCPWAFGSNVLASTEAWDLYSSQIMLDIMIIGIYSHKLHAAQVLLSLKQKGGMPNAKQYILRN